MRRGAARGYVTSRLINLIGWFLKRCLRVHINFIFKFSSMEESGKDVLQQLGSEWVRVLANNLHSTWH